VADQSFEIILKPGQKISVTTEDTEITEKMPFRFRCVRCIRWLQGL